jgi:hypothetical protein
MNTQMVQQVTGWIQGTFANQQTVSKDELMAKAKDSSLPQEAKDGLSQLPQGTWNKDELLGKVRDMMMAKVGGGMGGMMGG